VRLDPTQCYRALASRDPRFDGRVFVGVTSTGVYCRPVCRARTPRPDRCRFFATAARAEAHGFRPCLRCRPELAPGNAMVDATERLAAQAASLVEDGVLDRQGVETVAARLGITPRHLRRVFQAEFGVSPIAFAQTQRLLLAKHLLADTALPVTEVALASGFASVRRFNALVRARYGLAPSALRGAVARAGGEGIDCTLRVVPPYDWAAMSAFLAARTVEGLEEVRDGTVCRVLRLPRGSAWATGVVEIRPDLRAALLRVRVGPGLLGVVPAALARVKHVFDVACRPREVRNALGGLSGRVSGLRVPGAFDGFELAVRAVLGQQVSVRAARTLAARLVAAWGTPVETASPGLTHAFPDAVRLSRLRPHDVAGIGIPLARARTIVGLAERVVDGRLVLEPGVPVAATLGELRAVPGIGEWTAEYIAMRALGWPDAFPAGDLGVQRALGVASAREARARAEAWRPWRAYAVMHLWRRAASGTAGHDPGASSTTHQDPPRPDAPGTRHRHPFLTD
jgi:AraC family transcriptional regulator of adaptative response / DNA-3-methyladenine glycosylase II